MSIISSDGSGVGDGGTYLYLHGCSTNACSDGSGCSGSGGGSGDGSGGGDEFNNCMK